MDKKEFYEDLSKKVFAAMNSRDFDQLKDDMDENITFDFPGTKLIEGRRKVIVFLNALMRKYKMLTFKMTDIIIDQDKSVVIWTNFGEAPDGSEYRNNGATFIKFKKDKIVFLSDYFKDTSFTTL
jgi:ketosteroid isomerase-like protein